MEAGYPGCGAANGAAASDDGKQAPAPAIREQDRLMPIANVIRIMRRVLPAHAKISDDAKETIQECVSEYISFITGEANERCQREQRKTITAEDVLWAMSRLGFDDYVEPLSVYLHRYREFEGESRGVVGVGAARADHHHHHGHVGMMSPIHKSSRAQPGSMATHHDMQMHAAMYGGGAVPPPPPQQHPHPHHHHAFLMAPPHHGQYAPYEMYGGEHGMAAYYGAGMYAPGGGGGNGADGSGSSGSGGAGTPQTVNFEHQHPFGYK